MPIDGRLPTYGSMEVLPSISWNEQNFIWQFWPNFHPDFGAGCPWQSGYQFRSQLSQKCCSFQLMEGNPSISWQYFHRWEAFHLLAFGYNWFRLPEFVYAMPTTIKSLSMLQLDVLWKSNQSNSLVHLCPYAYSIYWSIILPTTKVSLMKDHISFNVSQQGTNEK